MLGIFFFLTKTPSKFMGHNLISLLSHWISFLSIGLASFLLNQTPRNWSLSHTQYIFIFFLLSVQATKSYFPFYCPTDSY